MTDVTATPSAEDTIRALTKTKDQAYSERNQCVALMARLAQRQGYPVWLAKHDPADTMWEADWRNILFIGLPTGQVSWHFHDSEMGLLDWVIPEDRHSWTEKYDGHTTEQKYERVKWCRP
jgi:hypothetical protein